MSALREADELINGDRAKAYGPPSVNFERIAQLWNAHIQSRFGYGDHAGDWALPVLSAEDVAWMMMQVKQARAMQGYKHDTIVDAAGYIGCIELMQNAEEEQ